MNYVNILAGIIIRSAILGAVLYGTWNYGAIKFINGAPLVTYLDGIIIMAGWQTLGMFSLRKVEREYVPIYLPAEMAPKPSTPNAK